jgi:hypothetical protein
MPSRSGINQRKLGHQNRFNAPFTKFAARPNRADFNRRRNRRDLRPRFFHWRWSHFMIETFPFATIGSNAIDRLFGATLLPETEILDRNGVRKTVLRF